MKIETRHNGKYMGSIQFISSLCLLCLTTFSLFAGGKQNYALSSDNDDEYDYIIVGAGAAGSALARKLSDDTKNSVLLLEYGINRSADNAVNTPAFDLNTITYDPRYAVTYTTPPFAPNGQVFTYTEGRMWGGGTGHHYLNAVRGTPSVYDFWAQASGNSLWSYENCLPTMKTLESYVSNGSPIDFTQRGTGGPMAITQSSSILANPVANAMVSSMNLPFVEDYNDSNQSPVGVSARQLFVTPAPNSKRSWAVPAFLTVGTIVSADGKGLNKRKLRIYSDALVSRVLFNNKNEATGVECFLSQDGLDVKKFHAKKKVILSAGAVNTPAILQRSGIGDKTHLELLGIPVVFDNPNVGSNFQNHYGVIGFISGATPDVIIGFTDMRPYMPQDLKRRMQFFAQNIGGQIRVQAWNLDPKSLGNVHIVDVNPATQPKINFNYYTDGSYNVPGTDAYLAVSFYKVIQDIAQSLGATVTSPPAADFPAPWGPQPNDAKLFADAQIPTNFVITSHIVGTARMAQSAATGVVDGKLNVFGVKNLMVADISIQPKIADGNTCYSAYVIGLKAADIIQGNTNTAAKLAAKREAKRFVKAPKHAKKRQLARAA